MTQKLFEMSGDEGGDKALRRYAGSRKSERLNELSNAQFTIRKVRFDQPKGHSRSPRAGGNRQCAAPTDRTHESA